MESSVAVAAAEPVDAGAAGTLAGLIGLSLPELAQTLRGVGEPERTAPLRARQLWHWLYHRGVTDPALMTTLPMPLRERLAQRYRIERPDIVAE
jgi:23S rRNA (adenine2503-C2)-methyltransferase